MERPLLHPVGPGPRLRASQTGTTLLEVLAAIFVMGIGLLTLLTLFPLGALEMAQAVKDDRAAAVADNAAALSATGEELMLRTASFVEASLAAGSADPQVAAWLRVEYEQLAFRAEDIELQLLELRDALEPEQIERYVGPLLAQIRSIQRPSSIRLTCRLADEPSDSRMARHKLLRS